MSVLLELTVRWGRLILSKNKKILGRVSHQLISPQFLLHFIGPLCFSGFCMCCLDWYQGDSVVKFNSFPSILLRTHVYRRLGTGVQGNFLKMGEAIFMVQQYRPFGMELKASLFLKCPRPRQLLGVSQALPFTISLAPPLPCGSLLFLPFPLLFSLTGEEDLVQDLDQKDGPPELSHPHPSTFHFILFLLQYLSLWQPKEALLTKVEKSLRL